MSAPWIVLKSLANQKASVQTAARLDKFNVIAGMLLSALIADHVASNVLGDAYAALV